MNRRINGRAFGWLCVLTLVCCGFSTGTLAAEPDPGDRVEVREGDVWSPAAYLRKEGRRYQVRYDDGTEEWITADRLRAPGSAPAPGSGGEAGADSGEKTPPSPAEQKAGPRRFKRGQQVELKDHNDWKSATIKNVSGELYLVATNDSWGEKPFWWKWVDAARLRMPGEDYEGPDVWGQFEVGVGNDSIRDSARKAKQAYQEHKQEMAEDAADEADADSNDPFAPPKLPYEESEPDRSAMQRFEAQPGAGIEAVKPDPDESIRLRSMSIRLRSGTGAFFENTKSISASGPYALVSVEDAPPGKTKKMYVERFDMSADRSTGSASIDAATLPTAISTDGQLIAGHANGFHGGTKSRLDVWSWQGDKPEHMVSFTPFEGGRGHSNDIAGIAFIDNERVLTVGRGGVVSLWQARSGEGLWETWGFSANGTAWALSPGRKYLACATQSGVMVLDVDSGKCLAMLPGEFGWVRSMSFSGSGRYLAAAGAGWFKVWDFEASAALPSVAVASHPMRDVVMFDSGQVLVDKRLYDAKTGRYVWAFEMPDNIVSAAYDSRLLLTTRGQRGQRGGFRVWSLPARAADASGDGGERLLDRGSSVSIDLRGLAVSGKERQALMDQLTAEMQRRGVTVSNGRPVRLIATTTNKSESRTYESVGGMRGPEEHKVNVTLQQIRFAIEVDGQTAWAQMATYAPSDFVRIEEGQSMQQAVDESGKGDAAGFIGGLKVPDIVPDPRQAPLGSSPLGASRN